MIEAIEKNLERGIQLLEYISDEEYSNTSIAPYYSSIGGHMRHILDVFDCIFNGIIERDINLIERTRNQSVENYTKSGIDYFEKTINQLNKIKSEDLNKILKVTDDLGLGVVTANYTLASILIQAHSHAIHHFASVGYIISQLGIQLPDDDFGFNPTTPRDKVIG
ncbi:MAG: DinB family protein [Lutibacter sp.]|uniref:DinB family protein n=1 Tax=Lutibacter sp. TaxID=1925666 RepID=UPI001817A37C|nr:DinB family protein [Lutibacter sp.]MBT8317526.1 DinB family protein [Lutibacter sp.]NNJ58385.1 DinB family protein [Lutibacter sp.]